METALKTKKKTTCLKVQWHFNNAEWYLILKSRSEYRYIVKSSIHGSENWMLPYAMWLCIFSMCKKAF